MFAAPILLAMMVAPEASPAAVGRDGDFVIEARTRYALAGGPLSIVVTLTYKGTKPIEFDQYVFGGNVVVEAPASWVRRQRVADSDDVRESRYVMQPGWTRREIVHLHAQYASIEAGVVRLPIGWRVSRHLGQFGADRSYHHLAQPKTELFVCIPPPSSTRLAAIRTDLTKRLDAVDQRRLPERIYHVRGSDAGMTELHDIIDTFQNTRHEAFIPLAMRFLALSADLQSARLIEFVYYSAPTASQAHQHLVDHLRTERPANILSVFNHWRALQYADRWRKRKVRELLEPSQLIVRSLRSIAYPRPWRAIDRDLLGVLNRQANLSDDCLRQLEKAPNIWVRALTYAVFGDRFDAANRVQLLADLERHAGPVEERKIRDLLDRLDAPRYAIRLAAQREIVRLGPIVEERLQAELRNKPSGEVERRIRMILADLPRDKRERRDAEALSYLESLFDARKTPDSAPVALILKALAKPVKGSWIARDAQLILEGRRKLANR